MFGIYILFTLIFIWLITAGITLVTSRFIPVYPVARACGIVGTVLSLFFLEHFIGLGKLNWLLPVAIAVAAWIFWKKWPSLRDSGFWSSELVFVLAFLYGFVWRLAFPDISPSSEQITDLFFISNYLPGSSLPPLDNWHPPHLFDYYYAFQHYAAALMGRVFNLDIGTCYSLAFAFITALPISLAWFIASYFVREKALRFLLVATLIIGGTGLSPLLQLAYKAPAAPELASPQNYNRYRAAQEAYARDNIITSARFIGGRRDTTLNTDRNLTKPGKFIFPDSVPESRTKEKMVLPAENFGYQYFVGDYHPSLGGFFLLLLALALMICIERQTVPKLAQALLAACVPVLMITNTWVFPLLVLLIGGWLAFRLWHRLPVDWLWLIAGGVAATFLIYPFLIGFAARALETPISLVPDGEHTPPSRFIAMHWPILALLILGFFEPRFKKLSIAFSAIWLSLLLLSEFIFIDDPTGNQYQRTNTTMKWWGWIHVGILISIGSICLGSTSKIIRWSTVAVLVLVNMYAVDLGRYWMYSGKYNAGHLRGHYWYTNNAANRQAFEYLKASPKEIVLENMHDNAYTNSSIYGIYNDKPVLLGWPSHLQTWHGNVPRVWRLKDEIQAFYRGEKENAIQWLLGHDVGYVVLSPKDDESKFDAINQQIKTHYLWQEFSHSQKKTGIWVRIRQDRAE